MDGPFGYDRRRAVSLISQSDPVGLKYLFPVGISSPAPIFPRSSLGFPSRLRFDFSGIISSPILRTLQEAIEVWFMVEPRSGNGLHVFRHRLQVQFPAPPSACLLRPQGLFCYSSKFPSGNFCFLSFAFVVSIVDSCFCRFATLRWLRLPPGRILRRASKTAAASALKRRRGWVRLSVSLRSDSK